MKYTQKKKRQEKNHSILHFICNMHLNSLDPFPPFIRDSALLDPRVSSVL